MIATSSAPLRWVEDRRAARQQSYPTCIRTSHFAFEPLDSLPGLVQLGNRSLACIIGHFIPKRLEDSIQDRLHCEHSGTRSGSLLTCTAIKSFSTCRCADLCVLRSSSYGVCSLSHNSTIGCLGSPGSAALRGAMRNFHSLAVEPCW